MAVIQTIFAAPAPASEPPAPMPRYGEWRQSAIGGGGFLTQLDFWPGDPRTCFAGSDVAGFFRSDDGGQTWRMLHGALPARDQAYSVRSFSVDPRNADHLLLACGNQWGPPEGIYRSTDGGKSWTRVLSARFYGNEPFRWCGRVLVRHPRDHDVLFAAAGGDGVWRSVDNGATWTRLANSPADVYPTALSVNPHDPKQLWLAAHRFRPYDRPELAGGFFRSDDGGETWRTLVDATRPEGDSPYELLPDAAEGGALLAIFHEAEIRRSTDAGETWTPWSEGLPVNVSKAQKDWTGPNRFQALAQTPDVLLCASADGDFYRRPRDGARWEKIVRGRLNQGDWFARDRPGAWSHFGRSLADIAVDPRNPARWLFGDWFAAYETTDAGAGWTLRVRGIETTVLHQILGDPADPGVVHLAMADNGYFLSEDGGETFRQPADQRFTLAKTVDYSPRDPARLYLTGNANGNVAVGLWVSPDRGRHWQASPRNGLPATGPERTINALAVDVNDPRTVFVAVSGDLGAGRGGVYVSRDGAETFAWMGEGLPPLAEFFQETQFSVGRELAAGRDGSLVAVSKRAGRVFRFDPAAKIWSEAAAFLRGQPFSIVTDRNTDHTYYLAGPADGVWRSSDAGATWQRVSDVDARYVNVDPARAGRVLAGTGDGVIFSENAGRTWRRLDEALPRRVHDHVGFAGDRVVVGTNGNGAFWLPLTPGAAAPVQARPPGPR